MIWYRNWQTRTNRLVNVELLMDEQREALRDKFAIAALTALLSHTPAYAAFASQADKRAEQEAHDKMASEAYQWADAMLKARDQRLETKP
jgi:hypothetical protein